MKTSAGKKLLSRRDLLMVIVAFILIPVRMLAGVSQPKKQKLKWIKLEKEKLGPGDFWSSHDPNQPERQGEPLFNLQLQATHPNNYGKPAETIGLGNGAYWRPVCFV